MEDLILLAKKYHVSKNYAVRILKLIYENSNITNEEISKALCLSPSGTSNIMKKMLLTGMIIKTRCGKYNHYTLSEEVKRNLESIKEYEAKEDKQECNRDSLHKTLFMNIISGLQNNVYVSYLSKDITFTFAYFSGIELMMLLFILGIYSYGEGQNFASVFGVNELLAVETEKKLLTKFQRFLFEVIQKYNMPLDGENKER